jgi:hypothetical protein
LLTLPNVPCEELVGLCAELLTAVSKTLSDPRELNETIVESLEKEDPGEQHPRGLVCCVVSQPVQRLELGTFSLELARALIEFPLDIVRYRRGSFCCTGDSGGDVSELAQMVWNGTWG